MPKLLVAGRLLTTACATFTCIVIFAVSSARAEAARDSAPVICIDPGHPSEVSDGMQRQNGTTETHCNWTVAIRLRKLLQHDGYRVVMTKRRENERVTNLRRAEIANGSGARLMVRLHCDTGGGSGYRIYYPDAEATDRGVTGPPAAVRDASKRSAEELHAGMADVLDGALADNGVTTDRSTAVGRRMGGALIGSIHSRVPVVLIEMVVLSSRNDAAFIKSASGQEKLARALAAGVERAVPLKG